jgi:hypothetical protein
MLGSTAWRPHRSLLFGTIALSVLLAVLATLQYRWLGQIGEAGRGEAAGRGALPRGAAGPGLRPRGHAGLPLAAGRRGDSSAGLRRPTRRASRSGLSGPLGRDRARGVRRRRRPLRRFRPGDRRSSRPNGRSSCGGRGSASARRRSRLRILVAAASSTDRPRPAGSRPPAPGSGAGPGGGGPGFPSFRRFTLVQLDGARLRERLLHRSRRAIRP